MTPIAVLRPALLALATADSAVLAAFGDEAVKLFDKTPANETGLYAVLARIMPVSDYGECVDTAVTAAEWDVWDRQDPPTFARCDALADALGAASLGELTLTGHEWVQARWISVSTFDGPKDPRDVHGVVRVEITTTRASTD